MTTSRIDKRPLAAAAAAQAIIVAGLNLIAAFGIVSFTADQMAAINGFLALILPAFLAFLIRNKVIARADLLG